MATLLAAGRWHGWTATVPRGTELRELVGELSRAVEAARRLGLATTVYLLTMALVEVREAGEAAGSDDDDDGAA